MLNKVSEIRTIILGFVKLGLKFCIEYTILNFENLVFSLGTDEICVLIYIVKLFGGGISYMEYTLFKF